MATAGTTTYAVDIVYDLKGGAQQGLRNIGNEAAKSTSLVGGLKGALAAVGAGTLFHLGKKYLVDFNSEVQRLKIGLGTVIAMNLHVPFARASVEAGKMFNVFQKMAMTSPNTTKEFVEMANMISSSVLSAGLGIKGLENMTAGAMVASNALGGDPSEMATGIQHALFGAINIRDKYIRQVLAGVGETDYKKFNKYSQAKRAGLVSKGFDQKALKDAGLAMGESFQGVTSTFKDNLEIALGQTGLPLMKALTQEIKSWTQYMLDNPAKIKHMVETLGNGIESAFETVRSVFSFIVSHADMMMELGKVWGAAKLAGGVSGMLGGMGGGALGSVGSAIGGAFMSVAQPMGASIGKSVRAGLVSLAMASGGNSVGMANGLGSLLGGIGSIGSGIGSAFASVGSGIGAGGLVGIGMATHELGEYLEVHKAITSVIDPMRVKYEQLTMQLGLFDDAIDAAAEKLGGKGFRASQAGTLDIKRQQAQVAGDFAAGRINASELADSKLFDSDELNKLRGPDTIMNGPLGRVFGGIYADSPMAEQQRRIAGPQAAKYQKQYQSLATESSTVNTNAGVSFAQMMAQLGKDQMAAIDNTKALNDLSMIYTDRYSKGITGLLDPKALAEIWMHSKDDLPGGPKPSQTNVTINKIEVYSDDPDRFVAQSVMAFDEITKNPTQAHDIMRGAF